MKSRETIVFIHGLGRTKLSLFFMMNAAKKKGYRVLGFNYPSFSKSGDELADKLAAFLDKNIWNNCEKVHFVTHSLGGYILSLYLQNNAHLPIGRAVLLAPPLGGSEIIDEGMKWPLVMEILGPAAYGLQRAPEHVHVVNQGEIAVIAGTRTQWPWSFFFKEPNDGKVSVSSTRQIEAKEHITVPYSHTELTFRTKVTEKALRFIETGSMEEIPAPA